MRKNIRLGIDLPVVVKTADVRRDHHAENLSLGGMLLGPGNETGNGNGAVVTGALIELEFTIPECPFPIECQAKVMHRTGDKLGVRFLSANLLELASITKHVMELIRH